MESTALLDAEPPPSSPPLSEAQSETTAVENANPENVDTLKIPSSDPVPDIAKPVLLQEDPLPKEEKDVQIDPVRNPKNYRYEIKHTGVWTEVSRLTPKQRKRFQEAVKRRFANFAKWYPFVIRFTREVAALSPARFMLHLAGSLTRGLIPSIRLWLSGKLISIAQTAATSRILRKRELFTVAAASYLSQFAESFIDNLLDENEGILQRKFEAMVNEHLMEARSRLDLTVLSKKRIIKDFGLAASLSYAMPDQSFALSEVINLISNATSLVTQSSLLYSMTSKENSDIAAICVGSAVLMVARWLYSRSKDITSITAVTDDRYNRMLLMEGLSKTNASNFAEYKVLNLSNWFLREYRKASEQLGEVSLLSPVEVDRSKSAVKAITTLSETMLYVIFALRAAKAPTVGSQALTLGTLHFIQNAANGIATKLFFFLYEIQHFGTSFEKFRAYYRILDFEPTITEPKVPELYQTAVRDLDGQERKGMKIEFKDVHFTWPGKKEKALNGLTLTIEAGELCCIVGSNGAGKSTFTVLLARLCDPDKGEILINGRNIKDYNTRDLYDQMSVLFQEPAALGVSLQEFIGVGNMAKINDLESITEAAKRSGAYDFISKLEKGFEAKFPPPFQLETEETLLHEAMEMDNESDSDSDEEDDEEESVSSSSSSGTDSDGKMGSDSGSDDEEAPKEDESAKPKPKDDENAPLSFSGGQKQKLVLARSFMKECDLLVLDEFSSSLDAIAESKVFNELTAHRGQRTIIYVTHRFTTVKTADKIIMLDSGKVLETGTHDKLIALGGKYKEFWTVQAKGFTDAQEVIKSDPAPSNDSASEIAPTPDLDPASIPLPSVEGDDL